MEAIRNNDVVFDWHLRTLRCYYINSVKLKNSFSRFFCKLFKNCAGVSHSARRQKQLIMHFFVNKDVYLVFV